MHSAIPPNLSSASVLALNSPKPGPRTTRGWACKLANRTSMSLFTISSLECPALLSHIKVPLLIRSLPLLWAFLGLWSHNEPPSHDLLNFWERCHLHQEFQLHFILAIATCLILIIHLPHPLCGLSTTLSTASAATLLHIIINI